MPTKNKLTTCPRNASTNFECGSTFSVTTFCIFFARLAYRKQFKLSSAFLSDGEAQAIINVL